jgi:hypothetical protein
MASKKRKATPSEISELLQLVLRVRRLSQVTAVSAAAWLDSVGLLRDSKQRRGKPLRDLLRKGKILGQYQRSNGRWYIKRK